MMNISSVLGVSRLLTTQSVSQKKASSESSETDQTALEKYLEELAEELEDQLLGKSTSTNPDGVGQNIDLSA
jgi:hypothetical protein